MSMQLRPITLEVKKSVITEFKRVARESFPQEAFAYLLGRDAGTVVEVEDLFIPLDLLDWTSDSSVNISDTWLPAARRKATDLGLTVIGDIHSHPFKSKELGKYKPTCAPSEGDLEGGQEWITGICSVLQGKTGKLRSWLRFWGPMFPVQEKIV